MAVPVIPVHLLQALRDGAPLIVSVSGGKDSQAMARTLWQMRCREKWTGEFILIHADLGRMEWKYSKTECAKLARRIGAEFVVVQKEVDGQPLDLLDGIHRRLTTLQREGRDVTPFPDAKNRWCTSDWKRAVINKYLRNRFPEHVEVVSCIGMRAEESKARAKKPTCELNVSASAPTKERNVWNVLPIHHWTLEEVWTEIGLSLYDLSEWQLAWDVALREQNQIRMDYLISQFPAHPAYMFGNDRVSCAICVLANLNDLRNGVQYNPYLADRLIEVEELSGKTFQNGRSLKEIQEGVEAEHAKLA